MQNWDVMEDMKLQGKDFWKGDEWVVNYLWTFLTYEAIFEIVKGARAGQEYLKAVAGELKDRALWHTPIYELPVLQPVGKIKEHRVKTILGTLSFKMPEEGIKRSKQLSSIAANFIHSIDATVLMGIIDRMEGEDIGTIHDCLLVHPNNGGKVTWAYKDAFVQTMKCDPLAMFAKELDPDSKIQIPYIDDLNLEEVYDSVYIIS